MIEILIRYCFGGATCVRIGSTGLVDSVVIAHPGGFSMDKVKAIKVPASWACAQGTCFNLALLFISVSVARTYV